MRFKNNMLRNLTKTFFFKFSGSDVCCICADDCHVSLFSGRVLSCLCLERDPIFYVMDLCLVVEVQYFF